MSNLPTHILAIQLRQLGDILLTTPVAREIKRQAPEAHVTFLSHPMGRLVLDDNPYIDEVFYYNPDSLKDELALAKTLRRRHFDVVFDFMNNPRSGFYSFFSGAKQRLSFASRRRWFYTTTVQKPKAAHYIVHEKFLLLEACGFQPASPNLVLPWNESHLQPTLRLWSAEDTLRAAPLRVVLSPTHRREDRRWPLSSYSQLADHLVRDFQAAVLWLWGPGEEEIVKVCQSQCLEKTYLAPKTSFREMAALLANCDLFIGNSNGPSHVAVATQIPTFQIHGPTRLASWSPNNRLHRGIEAVSLGGVRRSIDTLSVMEVRRALEELLPEVRAFADGRREMGVRLRWNN